MFTFGKAFRLIRKQSCLTQTAFAKKIRTSQVYVSTIEKEKNCPGIPIIFRLCKCFDLSLEYFFALSVDASLFTNQEKKIVRDFSELMKLKGKKVTDNGQYKIGRIKQGTSEKYKAQKSLENRVTLIEGRVDVVEKDIQKLKSRK